MARITIEAIKALKNNDGLTLKRFTSISYKSGWQVATEGKETKSASKAMQYVEEYDGNCGLWYHRVATKREAMAVGKACNQISVLSWRTMGLAYC